MHSVGRANLEQDGDDVMLHCDALAGRVEVAQVEQRVHHRVGDLFRHR